MASSRKQYTTIKQAIMLWEKKHGVSASDAEVVKLYMQLPPIRAMDSNLSTLTAVKHLALSTNAIEKISHLSGLHNIVTLSLSRNNIKKLENLEPISGTLQNLWISYNSIERLVGIRLCKKIKQLYIRYNKVKDWSQFEYLIELPELEDLEFLGNPLEAKLTEDGADYRAMALERLPRLKRLDGVAVVRDEEEDSAAAEEERAPKPTAPSALPPGMRSQGRRHSVAPGARALRTMPGRRGSVSRRPSVASTKRG
ncbi:dynein light chain 1 [Thecamonas trahens ATCC 50062]|uniref:Dynein axonemal light chain 1 n=1 Tax=Thecamonas trahens ATCC 50062 TaxID=461836 RepID=A0A0L0DRN8_THETB|nr:dynein light chain 1 [Thecamonas trahens ATCC 50062]KNC54917.1 dynein light chain 1 [Thecamonas trahens ATCC 50062]|eukprot:XP_013753507.1 dynein light chain 1 [Thecamonas trahens ATCC 50062]